MIMLLNFNLESIPVRWYHIKKVAPGQAQII
jgi:hypothetical protein